MALSVGIHKGTSKGIGQSFGQCFRHGVSTPLGPCVTYTGGLCRQQS